MNILILPFTLEYNLRPCTCVILVGRYTTCLPMDRSAKPHCSQGQPSAAPWWWGRHAGSAALRGSCEELALDTLLSSAVRGSKKIHSRVFNVFFFFTQVFDTGKPSLTKQQFTSAFKPSAQTHWFCSSRFSSLCDPWSKTYNLLRCPPKVINSEVYGAPGCLI